MITFSYTKYFVHSYTVDVVFTLSYNVYIGNTGEPGELGRVFIRKEKTAAQFLLKFPVCNSWQKLVFFSFGKSTF